MSKIKKENYYSQSLAVNDFKKIYFYKRDIKRFMPVPYKWKLDLKKLNEIKKPS